MTKFDSFRRRVETELFRHPVITANPYTEWFARGEADADQVADLVLQFSVFSNHFLVVQVKRMVQAATLEGERCARDILLNELGVAIDPRTGSPEGRAFSSANAHLNWLRELGAALGLGPMELGRWESAAPSTKAFLRGLDRSYGHPDGQIGAGASFAIETWAAFGLGRGAELEKRNFWSQLIAGLRGHNRRVREPQGLAPLPLGFFEYHFALESGHGASVWRELEESCEAPGFDPRRFLAGGRRALEAIHGFWLGLEQRRLALAGGAERALSGINVAQWAV